MQWQAYTVIEPFGGERLDWNMAMLASLIFNMNRDSKKCRAMKPEDFKLNFEGSRKRTDDELLAAFKSFADKHNAALDRQE